MALLQINLDIFHEIATHECIIIKITHTMMFLADIFFNGFVMNTLITSVKVNWVDFPFLIASPKSGIPTGFPDAMSINVYKWFWIISSNAKSLIQIRNTRLIVHTFIPYEGFWSIINPIIDGTVLSLVPIYTEWACVVLSIF